MMALHTQPRPQTFLSTNLWWPVGDDLISLPYAYSGIHQSPCSICIITNANANILDMRTDQTNLIPFGQCRTSFASQIENSQSCTLPRTRSHVETQPNLNRYISLFGDPFSTTIIIVVVIIVVVGPFRNSLYRAHQYRLIRLTTTPSATSSINATQLLQKQYSNTGKKK